MIDLDYELNIKPFRNGIKIVRPDQLQTLNYSLYDLSQFSIHVVLLNTQSEINHDKKVISEQKMVILEEDFIKKNNENFQALTIKVPWYHDEKIAGVFGFAIILNKHSLAESLDLMIKTGIFNSEKLGITPFEISFNDKNICFSTRERQCIELLVKGKTTKMIAKLLNLSPRTIEHYIENIKIKLNVNTKYEIIDRFLDLAPKLSMF